MPGTRTAPTIDGAPNFKMLSVSYYDVGDDEKTITVPIDAEATAAEIETVIDGLVPASNATIWRVQVTEDYTGAKLISNAVNAVQNTVQDVINVHYKNPTTRADFRLVLPAPLHTMLVANTEKVDTTDALFTGVLAAFAPVVPAGFAPTTARYSQHREGNESTPIG